MKKIFIIVVILIISAILYNQKFKSKKNKNKPLIKNKIITEIIDNKTVVRMETPIDRVGKGFKSSAKGIDIAVNAIAKLAKESNSKEIFDAIFWYQDNEFTKSIRNIEKKIETVLEQKPEIDKKMYKKINKLLEETGEKYVQYFYMQRYKNYEPKNKKEKWSKEYYNSLDVNKLKQEIKQNKKKLNILYNKIK